LTFVRKSMKLQDIIKNNQSVDFDFLQTDKELARQIQVRLINLGLLQGVADGAYADLTKASLTQFTKAFNLPAKINPQVAKQLIETKQVGVSLENCPCADTQLEKLPLKGVELIKQFERCYLEAYPDPLTGDKPITIGWGCTKRRDGGEWKLGDRITQQEADELLILQLTQDYLPSLQKISIWAELNENQKGALLSFAYNLGKSFFGSPDFQSITRVLKNREWEKVPDALTLYCNPGTSVTEGLRRRRKAEGDMWKGKLSN
jgi:lysozyme